jgi:hypothetical protein
MHLSEHVMTKDSRRLLKMNIIDQCRAMKLDQALRQGWFPWLAFCIIAFMSLFWVYSHSLRYFFWQDDFFLLDFVGHQSLVDYIRIAFTKPIDKMPLNFGVVFRPMTHYVYFWICRVLFGLEPSLYRLPIMLLLFFGSVLVAKYCQMIGRSSIYGYVAGILFVINRTHLTPVYWITPSHEIVAICFMLFSVVAYLRSLHARKSRLYYSISWVSLILALLTKENAIVTPVLAALSVLLSLDGKRLREKLLACRPLWAHFLIVLVYLAIRAPLALYALGGGGHSYYTFSYLANLPADYVWGFWWHWETFVEPWRMLLDQLTQSFSLFQPVYLSLFCAVLVLASAAWLIRSRGKISAANPIWLGLAWFVIAAAPALIAGVLADYLFSLSAVGFALAIAYPIVFIASRIAKSPRMAGLLLAAFLLMAIISARLVVLSLEKTTWPVKYMPLASETLKAARPYILTRDAPQTICLVDFPNETWQSGRAQSAFHVFLGSRISILELQADDLSEKCPPGFLRLTYTAEKIAVRQPDTAGKDITR